MYGDRIRTPPPRLCSVECSSAYGLEKLLPDFVAGPTGFPTELRYTVIASGHHRLGCAVRCTPSLCCSAVMVQRGRKKPELRMKALTLGSGHWWCAFLARCMYRLNTFFFSSVRLNIYLKRLCVASKDTTAPTLLCTYFYF